MLITLIGDSIFDNAPYTDGGPAVIDHLRKFVPIDWHCDLKAIDGSTTRDLQAQLATVLPGTTNLCLSIGGNDLIEQFDLLDTPVQSSAEALLLISEASLEFRKSYRRCLQDCMTMGLPLVVCTIYNCNFPTVAQQRTVEVALSVFNSEIITAALDYGLGVIELRRVCTEPEDYANPIEPSVAGGRKIAQAIARSVLNTKPVAKTYIEA